MKTTFYFRNQAEVDTLKKAVSEMEGVKIDSIELSFEQGKFDVTVEHRESFEMYYLGRHALRLEQEAWR